MRRSFLRDQRTLTALAVGAALVGSAGLVGCGGGGDSGSGGSNATKRIAYLAASSENGFAKGAYAGILEAAKKEGADVKILDGKFDPTVQFNQLEDIIASKQYDGVVILVVDGVGISTLVERAISEKIKVAAINSPIGPNPVKLEPQVKGLTTTVGSDQNSSSRSQADKVVDPCRGKNPCRVVLFHGDLKQPYDQVRRKAWKAVFAQQPNIKIVAEPEGLYSREKSVGAMSDVLQANPDVDVVLSSADQHIFGAEIALKQAGVKIDRTGKNGVVLFGRGCSTEAVDAVRAGRWYGSYVDLPRTEGRVATEALLKDLNGEGGFKRAVDQETLSPFGQVATPESLRKVPQFKGEWKG